jgi:hypothetical protein
MRARVTPTPFVPGWRRWRSKRTFLPGSARFRVLSQEKPAKMLNFSKFGLEKPDGTPTSDPSLYSVQS